MPVGRPRTITLSKAQMIALGEEMIKWVKKNQPLHLSEWYTIEKGYTYSEWKTMHVAPEFFPYYEQALKIVGKSYLNGNVNHSIAQRWQRVYFKDLREEEDDTARFHARIKIEEVEKMSDDEIKRLDEMISSLKIRRTTK